MTYIDQIAGLGACANAVEWLRASRHPTLAVAWAACPRGDWMLWLVGRLAGPPGSDSRRPFVLAACECVRLALPRWKAWHPDDPRPRRAIEAAEAWARGGPDAPTLAAVRRAADAAYDAAATNAAYAADAAYAAAYATTHAASAAAFAPAAAAAIVRKHYPEPPAVEGGWEPL